MIMNSLRSTKSPIKTHYDPGRRTRIYRIALRLLAGLAMLQLARGLSYPPPLLVSSSPKTPTSTGLVQGRFGRGNIITEHYAKNLGGDDESSSWSSKMWKKIPFVDRDSVKETAVPKGGGSEKSSTINNLFNIFSSAEEKAAKNDKKKMESLQKQLEANQRRQLKLIEQIRRDEEAEELALIEEQKIAAELASLEQEQKRKEKERLRKQKEAADRRNSNPPSVAQKFFSSGSEKSGGDKESFWSSSTKLISGMMDSIGGKVQEEWVPVMSKTRMFPGEVVPVQIGGIDLLVIASRDGKKLHCLANSCSHLGTPLELGLIESRPCRPPTRSSTGRTSGSGTQEVEDCIICPLHHTAFALESGDVRGEWCPYPPVLGPITANLKPKSPVAVFDIRIRGKNIEVRINSSVDESGQKKEIPVRKTRGASATRADQ